jgi:hypothetical protein
MPSRVTIRPAKSQMESSELYHVKQQFTLGMHSFSSPQLRYLIFHG